MSCDGVLSFINKMPYLFYGQSFSDFSVRNKTGEILLSTNLSDMLFMKRLSRESVLEKGFVEMTI